MSQATTTATNTTSNGITNDYYLNTSKYKYTTESDNSSLGKDDFLKILITQLQNQDPTAPMDDKEFIAQMAQFSSLEQMQNMTKAMGDLLSSQQETQLMSYTSFVGKEVKWHELSEKEVDENEKPLVLEGTGTVTEIKFKDGEAIFVLDSGKGITTGNISSILGSKDSVSAGATQENPFVQASQLIGQKVQYNLGEDVIQAVIEAVTTSSNGSIEYIFNNGSRLPKEQFTIVSENQDAQEANEQEQETQTEE